MTQPPVDSAPPSRETEIRARLVQRIAERRLELPLLPQTAADVMTLCNDTSCDAVVLSALIQRDQALAAHTLHVSNSAAYAPREPIVSLQQAVSRTPIHAPAYRYLADTADRLRHPRIAADARARYAVLAGQ